MAHCTNCGTKLTGAFCTNCGASAQPVTINVQNNYSYYDRPVNENANVKARYGIFSLGLASYLGVGLISVSIFLGTAFGIPEIGVLIFLMFPVAFGLLCYLPGFLTIRKNSPKDEWLGTFFWFVVKSIIFLGAWCLSITLCFFLVGLLLGAWRIGVAVSKPRACDYTVFVGNEKIGVTRQIDTQFSNDEVTRYIYIDAEGNLYRPPLHS